jgi:uncharacterized protein GlcG (DUF336 family)
MLTLSQSRQIVDRAIQRANELGIDVSVAVCDSAGRLLAFHRMDGVTTWDADRWAIGKAITSAVIGRGSAELAEHCRHARFPAHRGIVELRGGRGGLPVIRAGMVEGACGVSGAPTAAEDDDCARAGILALDATRSVQVLEAM